MDKQRNKLNLLDAKLTPEDQNFADKFDKSELNKSQAKLDPQNWASEHLKKKEVKASKPKERG